MLDGLVATVAVRERCQVALVEAGTMAQGQEVADRGGRVEIGVGGGDGLWCSSLSTQSSDGRLPPPAPSVVAAQGLQLRSTSPHVH